jgi:signal transduction histidine kinase
MAAPSPTTALDAEPIAIARRRLRRVRWIWLVSSLLAYYGWELVNHIILNQNYVGPAFLLDWLVVLLLGTGVMVFITAREDQRLAALEALAQERLQSERLAGRLGAVQETARAVAHALNQPLAAIRGYAELIQTAPPHEPIAEEVAAILENTERAAGLVRDLFRIVRYETRAASDGRPMLDLHASVDPPPLLE